jgi:hypothetical protein
VTTYASKVHSKGVVGSEGSRVPLGFEDEVSPFELEAFLEQREELVEVQRKREGQVRTMSIDSIECTLHAVSPVEQRFFAPNPIYYRFMLDGCIHPC